MRVVFLEDVAGVAQGGDVKDVKNGFARNYLIPQNLAVPATHNALQRIKRLSKESDDTRVKTLKTMKDLAGRLNDARINVEMRAGTEGRLYGSVTSAMIADKLSELVESRIDRRVIMLSEPLRQLGVFDVRLALHTEVFADFKVVVHTSDTDPDSLVQESESGEDSLTSTNGEATNLDEKPVIEPVDDTMNAMEGDSTDPQELPAE